MTVSEGPLDVNKTRIARTDYPHEEGLNLGTNKLKDDWFLEAEDEDLTDGEENRGLHDYGR